MTQRPLDATAGLLIVAIAAAILGSGLLLAVLHVINIWDVAGVVAVGSVLVAGAIPRQSPSGPRNGFVHGSAQAPPEHEAKAAAGGTTSSPLHDQTFPD